MATAKIKSTYSLDIDTVRALEELARRLDVSKSEALTRAIRAAAVSMTSEGQERLRALDALQKSLGLNRDSGSRWEDEVRRERRASSARGRR